MSVSPPWRARLGRPALKRIGLGLLIGALGGGIAHLLHVPLAWMLGSLFFCMGASLAGAPVEVPLWLRANFLIPVGLFLGESFDGLRGAELVLWPATLIGAILYVPVAGGAAYVFYRRAACQDPLTAICSAVPGGLTAVILISEELGGDERAVALSQSLRITLVIFAAPIVAFGLLGFTAPSAEMMEARAHIGLGEAALLLAGALAATWGLDRAGMPIPYFIGPILASAPLRMLGLVDGALPHWIVEIALVVTGASIGCRFAGTTLSAWLRVAGATVLGTGILLAVTVVFAAGATAAVGVDFFAALLAYAPGGIAEMSLIAIAIDADPGFVAVHHVTRIVFILMAMPLFALWFRRRMGLERAARADPPPPSTHPPAGGGGSGDGSG